MLHRASLVTAAIALGLIGFAPLATAQYSLADENFDDVIDQGNVSNSATPNVCLNSNCSNLTPGITAGSTANSNTGPRPSGANTAPDNANVRRGDNTINTSTGAGGFDSFFAANTTNGFLVLGDDSGRINEGSPNNGLSFFRLPFELYYGTTGINISFDWAFDGTDTDASFNDTFTARIINAATGAVALNILSRNSGTAGAGYGAGSVTLLWDQLNGLDRNLPGLYQLEFLLAETTANNYTQSAAGIDNISMGVATVPLPAAAWLLMGGIGLLGGLARRRRSQHA